MQKETEQKKRKQMEKFDMLGKHPGRALIFFAVPMILGNLLQQFYNMAADLSGKMHLQPLAPRTH